MSSSPPRVRRVRFQLPDHVDPQRDGDLGHQKDIIALLPSPLPSSSPSSSISPSDSLSHSPSRFVSIVSPEHDNVSPLYVTVSIVTAPACVSSSASECASVSDTDSEYVYVSVVISPAVTRTTSNSQYCAAQQLIAHSRSARRRCLTSNSPRSSHPLPEHPYSFPLSPPGPALTPRTPIQDVTVVSPPRTGSKRSRLMVERSSPITHHSHI